jgi:polysaccharide pyruvyl transferase WcaK-like protein
MTTTLLADARAGVLGPDVLTKAAILFSASVGPRPYPLSKQDLHQALRTSVRSLRPDIADESVQALAGEALAMFESWLEHMHELDRHLPEADRLSSWTRDRRIPLVRMALVAAAERWRFELLAARVDSVAPGGGW